MISQRKNYSFQINQTTGLRLPGSDKLFQRLHLLAEPQKSLMEMYWLKNCPVRHIATVQNVHPQTVRRHIRQWTERLLGEDYITFCRHRRFFSEQQMRVAYDRFILAFGYRKISRHTGLSYNRTRQVIKQLEFWLKRYKEDSSLYHPS